MPVFLRKLLPEKDFLENFKNTGKIKKTLVSFGIKKENNSLWQIWGYGYNEHGTHAEDLILNEIENYIPENQTDKKYKMTWFTSHAPCYRCSAKIQSFLQSRNGISMEIKASKPYFFTNDEEREGLHLLKCLGVSIKMMDKFDYEECLYLFVHPTKKFTSWPRLEEQSLENADNLNKLWEQEEKRAEETTRKIIKMPNHNKMIDSCNTPVGTQDVVHHHSPTIEGNQLSRTETPQKHKYPAKITEAVRGVKRKLDFPDN